MKLIRRLLVVFVLASGLTPAISLYAQQPQQQDEFVPAESLPQREQMPAAPLLVGAYAFVLLALFVYILSVARRLGSVQADIGRLEHEIKRGSRA
jgi:uncharacterized membrane protein YdbT with pleckstrin-like domain